MQSAWIEKNRPALVLAPMEGVTDHPMRALQSELGAFTHCVTEFLRVSALPLPPKVIRRHMRELQTACLVSGKVPVWLQLLGGNPERLALTAQNAVKAGAIAIDLNFGCPAPTVNRHDGGASLLLHPERIYKIVRAVRDHVPQELPVSVKMRLGWSDPESIYENAAKAVDAGAAWISVHGRTKENGYMPPAYWQPIGKLARQIPIPVVANGEIWTLDDFRRCRAETGLEHFMIGRGALANPFLPHAIAAELGLATPRQEKPTASDWEKLVERFIILSEPLSSNPQYTLRRLKQWLQYAHRRGEIPQFPHLKRCQNLTEFTATLSAVNQNIHLNSNT